jgi:hypothetical protein
MWWRTTSEGRSYKGNPRKPKKTEEKSLTPEGVSYRVALDTTPGGLEEEEKERGWRKPSPFDLGCAVNAAGRSQRGTIAPC